MLAVLLVNMITVLGMVSYYRYRNVLSEKWRRKCATLFNAYVGGKRWAAWGALVFLGRRALSIILVVSAANYPVLQIAGLFLINSAVLAIR